jgi:hypothetical protein
VASVAQEVVDHEPNELITREPVAPAKNSWGGAREGAGRPKI